MKLKNLLVLAVPAFFWAACSSDSESTPARPPVPTEISSASVDGVPLSSDSGSDPVDPAVPFVPEELVYDSIGFADIANAFHTVAPDEKVVFVLRHAERESGVGRETPLTENGILQAQSVGQKLVSADEFVYAHTAYVRTKETDRKSVV